VRVADESSISNASNRPSIEGARPRLHVPCSLAAVRTIDQPLVLAKQRPSATTKMRSG